MIILKNEILLLKSPSEDGDKFESCLSGNGFTVHYLPVLEFNFINLPLLKKKLDESENYSGIVFTSPRAVTATKISLNENSVPEDWQNKTNYVVGETTSLLAEKELNLLCKGSESGNANNLANLIIQDDCKKPLLFPCGNLKRETLQERLKEFDIQVDPVTVYETRQNPFINEKFEQITENYRKIPEYILFFSPSGVGFTKEIVKKLPLNNIKLIAIGPSTAKALSDINLPIFAVAAKPTETEVLNAIQSQGTQVIY